MTGLVVFATALVGLVAGAALDANDVNRLTRGTGNYTATLPPCMNYFAPFDYRGCYDDSRLRVLPWVITALNNTGMTAEYCQAACKGKSSPLTMHFLERH